MPSRPQIEDAVTRLAKEVLGEDVDPAAGRETVEAWDSLAHVELLLAVEEEFGVRLSEEAMSSVVSVDDLSVTIANLVDASG